MDLGSAMWIDVGVSYKISNLVGAPTYYPAYGDFSTSCVFRTYGKWWNDCPSGVRKIGRVNGFISDDFVEIVFEHEVIPERVDIYEIYNPGAIVKVYAWNGESGTDVDTGILGEWVILWEGQPERAPPVSRIFSPPLAQVTFCTRYLRLELCHAFCDYYTELDAVSLSGNAQEATGQIALPIKSPSHFVELNAAKGRNNISTCDRINRSHSVTEYGQRVPFQYSHKQCLLKNGVYVLKRIAQERSSSNQESRDTVHIDTTSSYFNYFSLLPMCDILRQEEVVQLLLSYLDLVSLCRLSQTCSLLHTHCYDPLNYIELSLMPHWSRITGDSLACLRDRCRRLRCLNLSWCGLPNDLTHRHKASPTPLVQFLRSCGCELTHLRLASCQLVSDEVILALPDACPLLQELDLAGCSDLSPTAWMAITRLTRLSHANLYRTNVNISALYNLLLNCHELEHLNIGSCSMLAAVDPLLLFHRFLLHDSSHFFASKLKSLNVWRCSNVTDVGVVAVAKLCPQLQEIDLGWCPLLTSNCYADLISLCTNLKKLFLTAHRNVSDSVLYAITDCCPNMQQLDILGTRMITLDGVQSILRNCKQLKLLDISFSSISYASFKELREQYPSVAIKYSFQISPET